LLILARFGETELSTATGFVVTRGDRHYLITNWHVATGRRPDTNEVISPTGGVPDNLAVVHNSKDALGRWESRIEPLYEPDGAPLWLEHPQHGKVVDVVALPLTALDGVDLYGHDPWKTDPLIAVGVSGAVTIVGFPFGMTGGGAFGIWVQGSIATEPVVDYGNLPCFLVDSRTRPGQSGSPVILFRSGGMVEMEDGGSAVFAGPVEKFLGAYSGRINKQSDLGIVWKATAIQEVINGQRKGPRP
jgi:hypothetical protein